MREAIFLPFRQYSFTICSGIIAPFLASVDKGTHGFSRGKTTPGCVILVGGRQPTCLVCLASRRLSSAKNSEGLAGTAGALPARQRTQACWRKSRTITPQAAFQPRPQARVPLSTDAWNTKEISQERGANSMSEKTSGFKIEESQRQSWLSIAAVWAGGMICVPCLMIGGVLAGGGLSWGRSSCLSCSATVSSAST